MTREANFDLSLETATPATSSDPSADSDLINKGFADQNYMQGGAAVADVAALKAVAAADRKDKDLRFVDSLEAIFYFDSASSATGDDTTVITPDAGTGRWLITSAGGTGSGSGNRNYLQDTSSDNAESNLGDWTTYADAAATTPVDGTGGTANITFTRNTTTPLRQTADFKLTVDAANRQGNGASVDFAVDKADRNKVLGIWCDVDATDENYVDDDLQVFIYDVDTDTLITPTSPSGGYKIKANKYRFRVAFAPADTTSVNYRLIVHVASTNATGYSVYFDNFEVGPGNQLQYGFDGIWKTYTASDFTPTSPTSGFSLTSINATPYREQGRWFLKGNAVFETTATTGDVDLLIPNVTTYNNEAHAISVHANGSTVGKRFAVTSSGSIRFRVTSGSSNGFWNISFNIPIASKPTWCDFDPIGTIYPTTSDLSFTPWESTTLTVSNFGSSPTVTAFKKRSLDCLELTGSIIANSGPSGTYTVTLPDSLIADTDRMRNSPAGGTTSYWSVDGWAGYVDVSASPDSQYNGSILINNTTKTQFQFITYDDGATENLWGTATNAPVTPAANDVIHFYLKIPVTAYADLGQIPPIGLQIAANGAPGLINFYQTGSASADNEFSAGTFYYTRIGNLVTLSWTTLTASPSDSNPLTSSGFLPSWARPQAGHYQVITVGTGGLQRVNVLTSGQIQFANFTTGFVLNNTATYDASSISYVVAD